MTNDLSRSGHKSCKTVSESADPDRHTADRSSLRRFDVSKLRVHNFVVSLDGYATGDGQSTQAAFGTAQKEFLPWFDKARVWRPPHQEGAAKLPPDGTVSPDEAIASAWGTGIGADIIGRNMFRPSTGPWPQDGWRGWWGEEPPFGTPCFVLPHWEHAPLTVGHTTFHFVSGTPADVLRRAREAAGGLDVRLGGGPTTVNEFLAADLVDYLHIIQVPIVLGRGVRLWEGLGGLHERYTVQAAVLPSGATHLFFSRP
jgi:dihydrofolate reductase